MDKYLELVEYYSSAEKIDELKLKQYFSKVAIWNFAQIFKQKYKNLSKDEQSLLLKRYYVEIVIRFGQEVNFLLSSCLKKYSCLFLSDFCSEKLTGFFSAFSEISVERGVSKVLEKVIKFSMVVFIFWDK